MTVTRIKSNRGSVSLYRDQRWVAKWNEYSQNGDGTYTVTRKTATIGRAPEMSRGLALESLHRLVSPAAVDGILPLALNTSAKGEISAARAEMFFLENGIPVSVPRGNAQPYDIIADVRGQLVRVQVKTAHLLSNGDLAFNCVSFQRNRTAAFYQGKADLFVACYPRTRELYGVDVATCTAQKFIIHAGEFAEYRLAAWLSRQLRSGSVVVRRFGDENGQVA